MHHDGMLLAFDVGLDVLQAVGAAEVVGLGELVDDVVGHERLLDRRDVRDPEETVFRQRFQTLDEQVFALVAADLIAIQLEPIQRRDPIRDEDRVIEVAIEQVAQIVRVVGAGDPSEDLEVLLDAGGAHTRRAADDLVEALEPLNILGGVNVLEHVAHDDLPEVVFVARELPHVLRELPCGNPVEGRVEPVAPIHCGIAVVVVEADGLLLVGLHFLADEELFYAGIRAVLGLDVLERLHLARDAALADPALDDAVADGGCVLAHFARRISGA